MGLLLVASSTGLVASPVDGAFNTGVDADEGLRLPVGAVDPHWVLTGGSAEGLKTVLPASDWVAASEEAGWIGLPFGVAETFFEMRFTLSPETDLMAASLSGSFAANTRAQIFLNDWLIYGPWSGWGNHAREFYPFDIRGGMDFPYTPAPETPFRHGENVLLFRITTRELDRPALLVTGIQPIFQVETKQVGPRCTSLVVRNDAPIRGGEIGLVYDPARVTAFDVEAGEDLPPGSTLQFRLDPTVGCEEGLGVAAGLTVAWINPVEPNLPTLPGTHEILRVCFRATAGGEDTCSPLRFVRCLGTPGAEVQNIVTAESGSSILLRTREGEICLEPELGFRRGDANADGRFDISDPVSTLGCLFLGTTCAGCPDAADSNDDGLLNIADAVYLLVWRFSDGSPPPSPFSECGTDETADNLGDCNGFEPCQSSTL